MNAEDDAEVNRLKAPEDTLGLHILFKPEKSTSDLAVDIIAIHGLGGDSFNTWTDKSTGKLWLRDFLPESEHLHNARIMTFGYDARAWVLPGIDQNTTARSFSYSESLLSSLRTQRLLTQTHGRPIIFIGHSLGGIIVKKALVLAHARSLYSDIHKSTKCVTFLGTPHQGADIAAWSNYLNRISKFVGLKSTNLLRELDTWSAPLLELSRTFSDQTSRLIVNSFYERFPYKGIIIVNEGSATLSSVAMEIVIGLDANHRTMCKFSSENSPAFRAILEQLQTTVYSIAETIREIENQDAVSESQATCLRATRTPHATEDLEQRFKDLGSHN